MNYQEKTKCRQWAKELRKSLDLKKISTEIENKIKGLDVYKTSKNVMSYMAKELEISLGNLFEDNSKDWYLPVVKNDTAKRPPLASLAFGGRTGEPAKDNDASIVAAPYFPEKTKLIKNKFGILEPVETLHAAHSVSEPRLRRATSLLDLILVPGLCFDKEGNRIGFGAGFYDKFLKLNPHSFKIGVCPKECLVDKLPIDSWDIKLDLVITDS